MRSENRRIMINDAIQREVNRRSFLGSTSVGVGAAALSGLIGAELTAKGLPAGSADTPHHPPQVKRVIFLCMAGGPSHLESFDYKQELADRHGEPFPESVTKGKPIAQLQGQKLVCQAPLIPFKRYGESGQQISEVFPHIGSVADDISILRSLHTDQINHDPAHT